MHNYIASGFPSPAEELRHLKMKMGNFGLAHDRYLNKLTQRFISRNNAIAML